MDNQDDNYITVAVEVWNLLEGIGREVTAPEGQEYNFNAVLVVQTTRGPVRITIEPANEE